MANKNTIQGINIEVGLDETNFNKGMKSVKDELKSSTKLSKEFDKALQLDPTNIDNINDALKANEKSIKSAQKQADIYNARLSELEDVNLKDLNNSIEQNQKELATAENEVKQLKDAFKELDKTELNSDKVEELKDAIKDAEKNAQDLTDTLKEQNNTLNNLDSTNMDNLRANAKSAENEVQKLQNKNDLLNRDLKALETESYEDLSFNAKKAAVNTGQLTQEQVGFGQALKKSDLDEYSAKQELANAATAEFGGVVDVATKFLNPYTAIVGVAAASLTTYHKETLKVKEASREFAINTNIATEDVAAFQEIADITAKTLGIDYAEALDIVGGAAKLSADEFRTQQSVLEDVRISYAYASNDAIELETGITGVNNAMIGFNDDSIDHERVISNAITLYDDYGKSADDVGDSLIEWSDTLGALGLTFDDTMTTFALGLTAGARSTDEIANAYNEFSLRFIEADEDMIASLDTLGTTQDDVNTLFGEEGFGAVILEVINRLADYNDKVSETDGELKALNDTTVLAETLFGTFGEEFIGTFAANEESVAALNDALDTTGKQTETLTGLQGILQTALDESGIDQNTIDYRKYSDQIKNAGLGTIILALLTNKSLSPAFDTLTEKMGLNEEQIANLKAGQDDLSNGLLFTNESQTTLTTAFDLAVEKGLILEERTEDIKKAYDDLKKSSDFLTEVTDDQSESYQNVNDKLGKFLVNNDALQKSYVESQNGSIGMRKVLTEEDLATKNLSEKIDILSENLIEGKDNQDKFKDSMNTLTSDTASLQEKIDAASSAVEIANDNYLISDETYNNLSGSIGNVIDELGGGSGLASRFRDATKVTEDADDATDDYNEQLEDSITNVNQLKGKLEKAIGPMDDFANSTDNAFDNLKNLNNEIDNYNSKSVSEKSAGLSTNSGISLQSSPIFDTRSGTNLQAESLKQPTVKNITNNSTPININVTVNTDSESVGNDVVSSINRSLGRLVI